MTASTRVQPWAVRRAVALLGGNPDEMPVLRAACKARSMLDVSVDFAWLSGSSAARPLIRELARDCKLDEITLEDLTGLLAKETINAVLLGSTLWRKAAGSLWGRLGQASAYVCRRANVPPASVMICADSDQTAGALMERVTAVLPNRVPNLTVLKALPPAPSWVAGLLAAYGCPLPVAAEEGHSSTIARGMESVTVEATVTRAVAATCSDTHPDLLVVGWHHHLMPLPEPALHPSAWRLSNSFPGDVLLLPVRAIRR
jgi:hypothetical protein